jgi:hypothetical protein
VNRLPFEDFLWIVISVMPLPLPDLILGRVAVTTVCHLLAERNRLPKVLVFLNFLIERFGSAAWRPTFDRTRCRKQRRGERPLAGGGRCIRVGP